MRGPTATSLKAQAGSYGVPGGWGGGPELESGSKIAAAKDAAYQQSRTASFNGGTDRAEPEYQNTPKSTDDFHTYGGGPDEYSNADRGDNTPPPGMNQNLATGNLTSS